MRSSRYKSRGGGGAAVCNPTAVWVDTFAATDGLAVDAALPDTVAVTDGLASTVKLFDTLAAADAFAHANLLTRQDDTFAATDGLGGTVGLLDTFGATEDLAPKVKLFDTFGADDRFAHADLLTLHADTAGVTDDFPKAQFRNLVFARSGTPDTDPCGDGWVDQVLPSANHGNENPLITKGKSTLADDERRTLMEFDFTRYANMTAFVGGLHRFIFRANNSDLLLTVDLTVQLSTLAARPFTESTVNWTNHPAAGTVVKTETFTLPANSTAFYTFTLTDTQLGDLLGDWGYIRMTAPTAVAPITLNIDGREASAANRPRWDFDLKR